MVKSREPIIIDNKFIKKILGYDDMRDFFIQMGNWSENSNFTALPGLYDFQKFIRAYIRDNYLDL